MNFRTVRQGTWPQLGGTSRRLCTVSHWAWISYMMGAGRGTVLTADF